MKEKELTRARDALAALRRRMPWMAVDQHYRFDGPEGSVSLPELFAGRRQLIVYRAFFEPGVDGWPEHACRGRSMMADHVGHLAHLNARDTTLTNTGSARPHGGSVNRIPMTIPTIRVHRAMTRPPAPVISGQNTNAR